MDRPEETWFSDLYQKDEPAWLESTARLAAAGRWNEIDPSNLREFLIAMSRHDKIDVLRALTELLTLLLQWEHQPHQRTSSVRSAIMRHRFALRDAVEGHTLFNYAHEVAETAYRRARQLAAVESGLAEAQFPATCPWSVDELLAE